MLLGIVLMVVATLWIYSDTALGLVDQWGQSETFAHGYVVPLITLWLIWRHRQAIAAFAPGFAPAPSALVALAAVAVVWLVGDLAEVNPLRQFALVGLMVLTVPVMAGWRAARLLLFPLGFLFFAVPFGEFLLPWLMARTADFTVLALRATGIPVYREGLQFVIPSGTWSVVEACSGVRYLIASLMVGALFAYLNYRSPKRRALFMLVALVVPIVANWLRAYMIVMIGHLSSNKLAVGVDHLIYGWVFFGIVVGLMFLIGARWAEPPVAADGPAAFGNAAKLPSRLGLWPAAAAALALLLAPTLVLRAVDSAILQANPQLAEPEIANALSPGDAALPTWTPAFVNPSAVLERGYLSRGHPVGLYVGYYRGQGPGRKLVSSSNALAKSNDPLWTVAELGSRRLSIGDHELTVKTARLRRSVTSSDTTTLAVRQVYWIGGRFEADDARAKAWSAWSRLRGRGDDGAVVIFYASERSPGDADEALDAMLREHMPAIELQLRRARDGA
jgi:exosortase A